MRGFQIMENLKYTILGQKISVQKEEMFLERFSLLKKSDVMFLYRGENKQKLLYKYNESEYNFPVIFSHKFFIIGDKGRNFLEGLTEEVRSSMSVYNIKNISENFFREIFNMVTKLLSIDNSKISNFKSKNIQLSDYFLNQKNVDDFCEKINVLDEKERISARDYYLTILHSYSKSTYYPFSFLLSTTSNIKIAEEFAGAFESEIIIYSWLPKESNSQYTLIHDYLNNIEKILLSIDLPVYFSRFFNQQEITLKGGLLPHYIIGYSYIKSNKKHFEINPWFLNEELNDNWVLEGLPINQDNFWTELKKTNILGAFVVDELGEYGYDML